MTKNINKTVNVMAMRFGKDLVAYPSKLEFDGRVYEFHDSGLALKVRRSGVVSHVLMLSDGLQQFRLRSDAHTGAWMLMSISA